MLIYIENDPLTLFKEHKGEFIIEPSRVVNPFFPLKMEEFGVTKIEEEDRALINSKKLLRENFSSANIGAWTSPCYGNHRGLLELAEKKEIVYVTPKIGAKLIEFLKEEKKDFSLVLNEDFDLIKEIGEIDPFSPIWLERVLKMVMLFYGKKGISNSFIASQQYKLLEYKIFEVDFEEIISQLKTLHKKVSLPSNNFINKAIDLSLQGLFFKENDFEEEDGFLYATDKAQEKVNKQIEETLFS